MARFWYVTMMLPFEVRAIPVIDAAGRRAVRFEFPHLSQARGLIQALGRTAMALRTGRDWTGEHTEAPEVDEARLLSAEAPEDPPDRHQT